MDDAWDVVISMWDAQLLPGLFQVPHGMCSRYGSYCRIFTGYHSLCMGYAATVWDVETFAYAIEVSVWAAQVLCGLLQPLSSMRRCYVGYFSLYGGY